MPTSPAHLKVHHSGVWAARRCPQRYRYAYIDRLKPRKVALPLERGIWLHYILQAEHLRKGIEEDTILEVPESIDIDRIGDVKIAPHFENEHKAPELLVPKAGRKKNYARYKLSWEGMLELLTEHVWSQIAEEEHPHYTEHGYILPEACRRIVRSYLFHYRKTLESEEVLLVEVAWERENENTIYRGRADLVFREKGSKSAVLRDWKTSKGTPDALWRLTESQLHLYPWGLEEKADELGIKIRYVEWDYLQTKPPTIPKLNQDGTISRQNIDTDALTFYEAVKEYGLDLDEPCYKPNNKPDDELKGLTPKHVIKQLLEKNEFFNRYRNPRSPQVTERLLYESARTAGFMRLLHEHPESAWRTPDQTCSWQCPFTDLCVGDLYGQDTSLIRERDFVVRPDEDVPVEEESDG